MRRLRGLRARRAGLARGQKWDQELAEHVRRAASVNSVEALRAEWGFCNSTEGYSRRADGNRLHD